MPDSRYSTAKQKVVAYRVLQVDPINQTETLVEKSIDSSEEGSGDKLLSVLQKLDICNVVVIVC
jgi:hypothetical protein